MTRIRSLFLVALAVAAIPAFAATPEKAAAREQTREARHAALVARLAAAKANHEIGGRLGLPLAQKIERENSPQDKLLVEVSYAVPQGAGYVAELKIAWGDLDNVVKKIGKEYYSNWDGSIDFTAGVGTVEHKIQFDDQGGHKLVAHTRGTTRPATTSATTRKSGEPGPGSGRDELISAEGTHIEWKAGVVGALDGLRIKITAPTAAVTGTIKAGKFSIPFAVGPAPATATVAPAATRK